MGRTSTKPEDWQSELERIRPYEPAPTVEGRETQLVDLAVSLTEYRMLTNTASSAEIVQYLKLGTSRTELETEKIRLENLLTSKKVEALDAMKEYEVQQSEVILALKRCRGEDESF